MTLKFLTLSGVFAGTLLAAGGCAMPESQVMRARADLAKAEGQKKSSPRGPSSPKRKSVDQDTQIAAVITAPKKVEIAQVVKPKAKPVAEDPSEESDIRDLPVLEELPRPKRVVKEEKSAPSPARPEGIRAVLKSKAADRVIMEVKEDSTLGLEEAILLALDANPDLQSAQERTQLAEGVLDNARAQFYPVLASNLEYQITDNPLRKFSFLLLQGVVDPNQLFPLRGMEDTSHGQLHVQQDIYTGGLRKARTLAAEADRDAAHASLEALHNRLVFQVAEAYYRVYQARALVGVRRETVAQVESQLKAVQSRFDAKTVVKSDVLKVEVRLAEVREALTISVNAQTLAVAILENVMGVRLHGRSLPEKLPQAPWTEIMAGGKDAEEVLNSVDNAIAEAVERRPEMSEVTNRMMAAEHRVDAAKSGKYPTVSAFSDFDVYSGDRGSNNSYFAGIALSLNVFDGHRTKTTVQQAQAQVRELSARHHRLTLDIELDVKRAHLQLKDARERLKLTEKTLTSVEENLRLVESRFREQAATTTELLDAQVLLSDVRVRSVTARADIEIARASLERSIGRLTHLLTVVEDE